MRVAHLCASYVPTRTEGISSNIDGLVQALDREGIEGRLDALPVELSRLNRRTTHLARGWRTRRLVAQALADPDVDVAHLHVGVIAAAAPGLRVASRSRRPRTPLVVHGWNALYQSGDGGGRPARWQRILHRCFNSGPAARWAIHGADAIIVSSRFQRKQIVEAGFRGPVHAIPNGIDTERFRPPRESEREAARQRFGVDGDPVVLYYGHLSTWKGVETLVDAFARLRPHLPRAQLVLAHTAYGGREAALRQRVRRHGLADRVRFVGVQTVADLHAAADLAVLPLLAPVGTACHPNVLLECLAAGVPVVASRVGSIPEVVRDEVNGLLAQPGNATHLADRILMLAADAALRHRLAQEGRRTVLEDFTWAAAAGRLRGLYEGLASRNGDGHPVAVPQRAHAHEVEIRVPSRVG